jgi:hypothetical protein
LRPFVRFEDFTTNAQNELLTWYISEQLQIKEADVKINRTLVDFECFQPHDPETGKIITCQFIYADSSVGVFRIGWNMDDVLFVGMAKDGFPTEMDLP